MDVPTKLELCLYDQPDILLVSLLFIAIPTPFLNFYLFPVYNGYIIIGISVHLLISEPLIINNGLDQSHQMMIGIVHVKSSCDPNH